MSNEVEEGGAVRVGARAGGGMGGEDQPSISYPSSLMAPHARHRLGGERKGTGVSRGPSFDKWEVCTVAADAAAPLESPPGDVLTVPATTQPSTTPLLLEIAGMVGPPHPCQSWHMVKMKI